MNLHQIVSGQITSVNPNQPAQLQVSNGYVTGSQGRPTPLYLPPVTVTAQVQELTTQNLRQLEALNIQGSMRKIYLNGLLSAGVRVNQQGGDLVTLQDGSIWLTTAVLEAWPDWCAVSCTLQNGS